MRVLALLAAAALSGLASAPSAAESCTAGDRELGGVKDAPQVREHVCQVGPEGKQQPLRVTFLRLNEVLAGNLAMRERTPEILEFFGEAKLVENEVFAVLEPLFRQFGHKQVFLADDVKFALNVNTPQASGKPIRKFFDIPPAAGAGDKYRRLWSISSPYGRGGLAFFIDLKAAHQTIRQTDRWPAGFQHTYTCTENAVYCTGLWRYLQISELAAVSRETDQWLRAALQDRNNPISEDEVKPAPKPTGSEEVSDWPGSKIQFRTHFAYFNHLAKGGWPDEFLVATGGVEGCASDFEFNYYVRPLGLDVALIENSSSEPVRIDDFLGRKDATVNLRRLGPPAAPGGAAEVTGQAPILVPQKSKIVVPLRVFFQDATEDWSSPKAKAVSERMYKSIQMKRPAKFWKFGVLAKKSPASFLAPSTPPVLQYAYGPEISVAGLVADGKRYTMEAGLAPLVAIVEPWRKDEEEGDTPASDGSGDKKDPEPNTEVGLSTTGEVQISCPILYAWAKDEKAWVHRGKVVDSANGPSKEATSIVAVDPSMRRFRLAEEEPEVAYIRRVQLLLTLRDGRRVSLDPREDRRQSVSGFQFIIPAYSKADISFEVSEEYESVGIDKSEIAITGYYRRLSDLRVSRLTTEVGRK